MNTSDLYTVTVLVGSFGVGVAFGLLLYRALWRIDTESLRQEIVALRTHNMGLLDDVIRLGREVQELRQRMERMEAEEVDMRAQLRLAAKRERQGGA